jgi:hypothetical protein
VIGSLLPTRSPQADRPSRTVAAACGYDPLDISVQQRCLVPAGSRPNSRPPTTAIDCSPPFGARFDSSPDGATQSEGIAAAIHSLAPGRPLN